MIIVQDLEKEFDHKRAIGPLSMTLEDGKVYGLLGSNGSGKSTLLRSLCGIYRPDGGHILVDGQKEAFENNDYKNELFLVSDDPFFFSQSSIREMACFYREFYSGWDETMYENLCSIFPLDTNARVSDFSKGMKRQAAIILGFSVAPRYLFLDEAFDGLDPVMRNVVKRIIANKIVDGSMTIVITSHNISEFENMCDVITIMHQGQKLVERDRDEMNYILKVQVAFAQPPTSDWFTNRFQVIHCEVRGRLATLTLRGEEEQVVQKLEAMHPLFLDVLPASLEEIFLYEMGGVGYNADQLI